MRSQGAKVWTCFEQHRYHREGFKLIRSRQESWVLQEFKELKMFISLMMSWTGAEKRKKWLLMWECMEEVFLDLESLLFRQDPNLHIVKLIQINFWRWINQPASIMKCVSTIKKNLIQFKFYPVDEQNLFKRTLKESRIKSFQWLQRKSPWISILKTLRSIKKNPQNLKYQNKMNIQNTLSVLKMNFLKSKRTRFLQQFRTSKFWRILLLQKIVKLTDQSRQIKIDFKNLTQIQLIKKFLDQKKRKSPQRPLSLETQTWTSLNN